MATRFKVGARVRVKAGGGFDVFTGATGRVLYSERDGQTTLYRVRLDGAVKVPSGDYVTSDLWSADYLELEP